MFFFLIKFYFISEIVYHALNMNGEAHTDFIHFLYDFVFTLILGQFKILGVQLRFWDGGEKTLSAGNFYIIKCFVSDTLGSVLPCGPFLMSKIPGPHEHK